MPQQRIKSFDSLKGLMMFLVVLGHLFLFSYGSKPLPVIVKIFTTFHVPVFFFVSGMFFGIDKRQAISEKALFIFKKGIYLIVPSLFFYVLYYYTHNLNPFAFVTDGFGFYWFLPVLFFSMLIIGTINIVSTLLKINKIELAGAIFTALLSAFFSLKGLNIDFKYIGVFHLHHLFSYFPFFVVGYMYRLRRDMVVNTLKNKTVITFAVIISALSFVIIQFSSEILPQYIIGLNYSLKLYSMPLVIMACFSRYQHCFESESKVNSFLVLVGRYTLPIYLLHYYFLPDLNWLRCIIGENSTVLVLLILIVIAVAIIGLCVLFTKIISTSDFIGHYLLGQKSNKFKI